jgi:hypothetical protein
MRLPAARFERRRLRPELSPMRALGWHPDDQPAALGGKLILHLG